MISPTSDYNNVTGENLRCKTFGKGRGCLAIYSFIYNSLILLF